MKNRLEICCVSLQDCLHAQNQGANRIELCASMAAGGLTPSFGLFQLVKQYCSIPVMVMIRPRGAGFCYEKEDYEVMRSDATYFLEHGADGIVFGFLDENRMVDIKKTKAFVALAHHYRKEAVFHRAIDQCEDVVKSAVLLESLGVDRILSAGGPNYAQDHECCLRVLQKTLNTTQLQMCGSIRADNVVELIKKTKIHQIHSACRVFKQDASDPKAEVLYYTNAYDKVCHEQVANMVMLMETL